MSRKKFDNATAAAAKFITLPDEAQKKPEATEEPAKKRGRPKKAEEPKPEEPKPQRKSDRKKAFSVWMDTATADEVKLYSAITGEKMTDILEAAVKEYLTNHELTAEQKEAYKKRERERINNI